MIGDRGKIWRGTIAAIGDDLGDPEILRGEIYADKTGIRLAAKMRKRDCEWIRLRRAYGALVAQEAQKKRRKISHGASKV